jgi:CRISPR/Cas system-associated exonuclease Cas4 (RecB family)
MGSRGLGLQNEEADLLETETSTGAFLAYLQAALQSGELGVPNELDVEGEAVSLFTAHRSKGLEWPVVFVPFCVEGQFPSRARDSDLPLPPGLIATDDADPTAAHLREEACLFYVAVTRARDRLFLSSAEAYGVRGKGEMAALRQALMRALHAAGRLDAPTISLTTPDAEGTEAEATEECLPYPVPEHVHERDLRTYEECPRRFLYQHIYGLPEADTAFLAYYRSVYGAARDASGDARTLRERFEARWRESGPPDDHWQAPLLRCAAERLIDRVENQLQSGSQKTYRQEKTLLLGALDDGQSYGIRFTLDEESVQPDGRRLFRRHKQGSRLPKNVPDDDIVTLYALLADQESPGAELSFYYPHLNQDLPAKIGERKKANLRERKLRMISDIQRGEMPPKPTEKCKRCPHTLICDRGVRD